MKVMALIESELNRGLILRLDDGGSLWSMLIGRIDGVVLNDLLCFVQLYWLKVVTGVNLRW